MASAEQEATRGPVTAPAPLPLSGRRYCRRIRAHQVPTLSVVIVNYRQWHETADLTRDILRSAPARRGAVEVVVVDNHSPTHPLTRRLRRWQGVSLRRWRRNRGFARAVNEGCRLSRGEWILLLNPDVSVGYGFVEDVLDLGAEISRQEPHAGVIGFQLSNPNGTLQLSSGVFPTLAGTVARLLLPRARRKYHTQRLDRRSRVNWVTGCCWLVRRDCLRDLGGLDEDFFLYYEDVDFCFRAAAAGWSIWYEPAIAATHHRPLHARSCTSALRLFTRHALLTYAAKHWPVWQFRVLTRLIGVEAWLRQFKAHRKGDPSAATSFHRLAAIARKMRAGKRNSARRMLDDVVQRQERHCAA
jgi:GT2 family glycosyltransferase